MKRKKYTDEQEKEIVELLRKGIRNIDIAKKYGINRGSVSCIKKKFCPDLTIPRKRIPDEIRAEVVKLILDGWLYIDIAKHLHISNSTVGDIGVENGFPKKKYHPKAISIEIENEFINLVQTGSSVNQSASLLGISEASGYRICEDYGITDYLIRREELTDTEKNEVNKLYAEGCSYEYICEKLNVSTGTISRYADTKRHIMYNDEQIALLCELVFVEKMSIREASEIADIKFDTARNICYKYRKEQGL